MLRDARLEVRPALVLHLTNSLMGSSSCRFHKPWLSELPLEQVGRGMCSVGCGEPMENWMEE